ncbi:alpha/beta fold hydrolase [Marinibactrum halimedae]|uniref:Alpha/beta hydrolase n=1 Tax=Marinibactrum halimedae TaxID=1444977 RepID=A0AA37WP84_9GAMM|nr:alpha/beta hydrolase [Marinibactrum halimedae]MCD9459489.1 alpha/beta hydrolase [Marinibactrum halimedae]GLS28143.1 alpha/beta hydrolase [Marinibactrum halimedae]
MTYLGEKAALSSSPSSTTTTLQFSHANGFPFGSYQKLFQALPTHYQVQGLERFGHNPAYPISQYWGNQIDELIEDILTQNNGPVYGVGHSFGGLVTYMAACRAPDLFRGIILLDPPLITGPTRWLLKLMPTPVIDKITPAGKSKIRNTHWPLKTDLVKYFSQRALFNGMSHEVIADYVEASTDIVGEYRKLNFSKDVETAIFRNLPLNLPSFYGQLTVPGMLLAAEHSHACMPSMYRPFLKRNTTIKHRVVTGLEHMFPLQAPEFTAQFITDIITHMESESHL